MRPHLLGIDDGPVEIRTGGAAEIVGVMMEAADLVEAVAVTRFPIDGEAVTEFLGAWVLGLRLRPALQGIVLGGITIAGLGIIDLGALAARTGLPVLAVSRRDPRAHRLGDALRAAGLESRLAIVERTPHAFAIDRGVYLACAGVDPVQAAGLARASTGKAGLPEPLRLAHMVARAIVTGESRGRA